MSGPLSSIRILDISNVLAGPVAAQVLGDYGAEVIKVEHPLIGDGLRNLGRRKDDIPIWWKVISRNKKLITLDLSNFEGQEIFKRLVQDADVVVENFRPGTLERWGLGYDQLKLQNPKVIMLRITGFGQSGPYSARPAFGTLIEAMSGFAASMGENDGPPVLPPLGLADTLAGISGALAVTMALFSRDRKGGSDRGQEIDLSILEPLVSVMSPQPSVYDLTGEVAERIGNRSELNAPRNLYKTVDGKWIAMSSSTTQIATRVMHCIGRPDIANQDWFQSGPERVKRGEYLDSVVAEWVSRKSRDEAIATFEKAQAAVGPVYSVDELMSDPHCVARGVFQRVQDDDFGSLLMPGLLFQMSETPGKIAFSGSNISKDTDEILGRLGISTEQLIELRDKNVI